MTSVSKELREIVALNRLMVRGKSHQEREEARSVLHDALLLSGEYARVYEPLIRIAERRKKPRSWSWSNPYSRRYIVMDVLKLVQRRPEDAFRIFSEEQMVLWPGRGGVPIANVSGWQNAVTVYVAKRVGKDPRWIITLFGPDGRVRLTHQSWQTRALALSQAENWRIMGNPVVHRVGTEPKPPRGWRVR